ALARSVRDLARRPESLQGAAPEALARLMARVQQEQQEVLAELKAGWADRAMRMENWIGDHRAAQGKCFNGVKMKRESVAKWFQALRDWAADPELVQPALNDTAWRRLTREGISDACAKGFEPVIPDDFDAITPLAEALSYIQPLSHALY